MSDEQYARTGRFMFLFVWIIIFIGLFFFFSYYGSQNSQVLVANHQEFSVTANPQGHYVIDGRINEYPVAFLIDTGATLVAIPQKIADKININGKYPVSLSTANGEVTGFLTRVEQISFGAFTVYDVKAVIIPDRDDDTVLLGMNVLSRFNITQSKKRLILKNQDQ
jgi:aspartyl protease family protein